MGRAWIRAIDRADDAELVGLVDLDPRAVEAALAARGPSVASGTDAVALARAEGADGIVDVTVPVAHLPVNLAALDAGYPVLCEKPVTPTVRDALILVAASETTGRLLMVSQSRRYYAALDELRRRAADLGGAELLSTEFLKAPHFGGFREEMDHPLLVDMAIHSFDVARAVLDRVPLTVDCRSFNPSWSWFRGDAAAEALFEFEGGARFQYFGSWVAPGLETSWNGSWRAGTARGTVTWDGESAVEVQEGDGPVERLDVVPAPHESIEGSLAEFLAAVRSGASPSGEIHANVWTLAMVEAAVRSAETRTTVDIPALIDDARDQALATDIRDDLRTVLASWSSPHERLLRTAVRA
ncbi:gfo/Idh/MocA family oxidoreductase [Amnibacterium setariae]|uniref:Gfo/Idh/MocA family oxidoreductase n=2 Tax=Amnibacterium setariae TaxID=2306585 RepID=A0A3A1TTG9_9MICO|nr:gfo/Idh/MocA family oxidoreductase [Amnibacterium setariae]